MYYCNDAAADSRCSGCGCGCARSCCGCSARFAALRGECGAANAAKADSSNQENFWDYVNRRRQNCGFFPDFVAEPACNCNNDD